MIFTELFASLSYNLFGLRVPRVALEVFAPLFVNVLDSMIPSHQIVKSAGINLRKEWDPSEEILEIDAHAAHLLRKWQPAHNSMQDLKPERKYQSLHRKAMMASRAYGETVATYIEYRRLFLSPQYLTKVYYQKGRHGKQWDALAREYAKALLDELDRIQAHEPQAFRLLVPSGDIPEGIESIATEMPEFLSFQYAVSPFD